MFAEPKKTRSLVHIGEVSTVRRNAVMCCY